MHLVPQAGALSSIVAGPSAAVPGRSFGTHGVGAGSADAVVLNPRKAPAVKAAMAKRPRRRTRGRRSMQGRIRVSACVRWRRPTEQRLVTAGIYTSLRQRHGSVPRRGVFDPGPLPSADPRQV